MGARANLTFSGRSQSVKLADHGVNTWRELCKCAETLCGMPTFVLKYEDEEGDLRVLTEETLEDAAWVAFGLPSGVQIFVTKPENFQHEADFLPLPWSGSGDGTPPALPQVDFTMFPARAFANSSSLEVGEDPNSVHIRCSGKTCWNSSSPEREQDNSEGDRVKCVLIPKPHAITFAPCGFYSGAAGAPPFGTTSGMAAWRPSGPIAISCNGEPLCTSSDALEVLVKLMCKPNSLGASQDNSGLHSNCAALLMQKFHNGEHSPILGYAFDGFPIYGPIGLDSTGLVKWISSSYVLTSRAPSISKDDFEFHGNSGDLDICNGIYSCTPEYPNGTYHYVLSIDIPALERGCLKVAIPFFLARFRGLPKTCNFGTVAPQALRSEGVGAEAVQPMGCLPGNEHIIKRPVQHPCPAELKTQKQTCELKSVQEFPHAWSSEASLPCTSSCKTSLADACKGEAVKSNMLSAAPVTQTIWRLVSTVC